MDEVFEPQENGVKEKTGFFSRLKNGLSKTRQAISESVDNVLKTFVAVDDDLLDELEEALIGADIGAQTAMDIIDELRDKIKSDRIKDADGVKAALKDIIASMLEGKGELLDLSGKPSVILVIGVNGVGKTTSIGKIASHLKKEGKSVLLAAADTFRAAAVNQLKIWADRVGVDIVQGAEGADPASVIFDACTAAKKRGADVLICDTAGRLHNKKNLMEELKKIYRIIDKEMPGSSKETLLVLDASTGQNAQIQAEMFSETADITGIILTKLDGTAKGGIVVSISNTLNIPVKFVGVGEEAEDLQPFSPQEFVNALFDEGTD
ncbi:MAG: signal recognition particle-docking protein FtsY [Clostridia bacterium]|nr:signal recognition particle-docking protein FtsY [Clostridia bacterium]